MTWYAASIIIAFRPIGVNTERILVHENVYLIEASDVSEACFKARQIGESEAALDDGQTINNIPAKSEFAGIRKIISVSNPPPLDVDKDRPCDGSEITYSVFEVLDDDALKRLSAGDDVDLNYLE